MSDFTAGLYLMMYGLLGVFTVLVLFYLMIKAFFLAQKLFDRSGKE